MSAGKGDRNRSNTKGYRDGYERIFSKPSSLSVALDAVSKEKKLAACCGIVDGVLKQCRQSEVK